MKLSYNNDHIVRFKNGDVWHFFYQKGKGIYFRILKKNGQWGDEIELVANAGEHFSAFIDNHDHVHFVCQDYGKEILYMEYNGKKWNKEVLYQYDASSYPVQFPTVIVLNEQVHVIFTVGTTPFTGIWSLYHCYHNGTGWVKEEIIRYADGKQTSPFYIDGEQGKLHLVYRGLYQNYHRLFYCCFDSARNRWSRPESLSRNMLDCNMPSILVKGNKLHLAWTSIKDSNLQIMYRNWSLNSYFKTDLKKEAFLSNRESNCSAPQLFWLADHLWCIWYQNDDIYCCSSPDEGMTWSQAKPLEWPHKGSCSFIKYLTNYPNDKSHFKVNRIFANLDNGLEIPILGEYLDFPKPTCTVKIEDLTPKQIMDQQHIEHAVRLHTVSGPNATIHDIDSQDINNIESQKQNLPPSNTQHLEEQLFAGNTMPDNIVDDILALIQEINKAGGLKARFQALLDKNQLNQGSMHYLLQLDTLLNSWIKKAEEIQAENQNIMREIESLRRRSIENCRQWEVLLEEFEEVKELLEKNLRKGFLRKIIGQYIL
ncbi:hypothetical protein JOD02_000999 [Caldicoprobacter guelmensis]|uniref:hypothetical protein n=1 Tax=Caldicoprobacter guelmensis TaxID=1170224 RepID=UPI00195DFE81|nr:hypothetical protein [Caldicoprobacter guelmensis]MBM7582142.1 hypothetical protein [Caldicoprobacter guelmensis]